MEGLLVWVLNFILAGCNYSYQVTDYSMDSISVIEAHTRVERYLHEGHVLNPGENLKDFFARPIAQQAFREGACIWLLTREDVDRFIMIMNQ